MGCEWGVSSRAIHNTGSQCRWGTGARFHMVVGRKSPNLDANCICCYTTQNPERRTSFANQLVFTHLCCLSVLEDLEASTLWLRAMNKYSLPNLPLKSTQTQSARPLAPKTRVFRFWWTQRKPTPLQVADAAACSNCPKRTFLGAVDQDTGPCAVYNLG